MARIRDRLPSCAWSEPPRIPANHRLFRCERRGSPSAAATESAVHFGRPVAVERFRARLGRCRAYAPLRQPYERGRQLAPSLCGQPRLHAEPRLYYDRALFPPDRHDPERPPAAPRRGLLASTVPRGRLRHALWGQMAPGRPSQTRLRSSRLTTPRIHDVRRLRPRPCLSRTLGF